MDITIWDFDNVLFRNPNNIYSDEILARRENVVKKDVLEQYGIKYRKNAYMNILLTGRGEFQKNLVEKLLMEFGYKFDATIFYNKNRTEFPEYNKTIDAREFYINYWHWKISNILRICRKFSKYDITIIDDDEVLNLMCKKLNIKCIQFDARKIKEEI